jgi:cation transport protein ChaC
MQRDGDRWVFGYGSLMWRPGFAFEEKRIATIHGYHRSLCVYSHVHRGTQEAPGLVLGLDRGGSCQGVAFRVRDENWNEVIDYLREREQVTSIYLEILLKGMSGDNPAYIINTYDHLRSIGVADKTLKWLIESLQQA